MKLPFKTLPKQQEMGTVGNEDTGTIEIPKLYDLSVNERIYLDQKEKRIGVESVANSAVKFAKKIATGSGIKFNAAYDAIINNDMDVIGPFADELVEFNKEYAKFTLSRKIILATLMLRRVQKDITEEVCGDATQVPPKLVDLLAEYAEGEMRGWVEPEEQIDESVDPEEGKPEKKQTGQKSIGK